MQHLLNQIQRCAGTPELGYLQIALTYKFTALPVNTGDGCSGLDRGKGYTYQINAPASMRAFKQSR